MIILLQFTFQTLSANFNLVFGFIGKLGVSFVCDNTDGLHLYFCIFSIYMNLKEPQRNAKPKSSNAEPEPDNTKATRVGKSHLE